MGAQSVQSILVNIFLRVSTYRQTVINEIPNHIDFQIKKSVLEHYDLGKITREQAIDSVRVTYF